jgi:hypothetical protein
VQFTSVLIGFGAFVMAGQGAAAPVFGTAASKVGTPARVASTRSVDAARQCGGLNHEGGDAVYYNCTTHPVKIEISHNFGVRSTIACVPALGQYHSTRWNTKDQKRVANNCD